MEQEFLKAGIIIKISHYGIWIKIFSYLTVKDIIQLRVVDKKLYLVVKNTGSDFFIDQKAKNKSMLGQLDNLGSSLTNVIIDNLQKTPSNLIKLEEIRNDPAFFGKDILDIMKYPKPSPIFQQIITALYYLIHTTKEIQKTREFTWNT